VIGVALRSYDNLLKIKRAPESEARLWLDSCLLPRNDVMVSSTIVPRGNMARVYKRVRE